MLDLRIGVVKSVNPDRCVVCRESRTTSADPGQLDPMRQLETQGPAPLGGSHELE